MVKPNSVGEPGGRGRPYPHGSLSLGPRVGEIILWCLDNRGVRGKATGRKTESTGLAEVLSHVCRWTSAYEGLGRS